jgi:hypothetical protein
VQDVPSFARSLRHAGFSPVGAAAVSMSALFRKQLPFYLSRSYNCLKRLRSVPFIPLEMSYYRYIF